MPPRKSEFQVHGEAAAKKPRTRKKRPAEPVKIVRANPVALKIAHEIAHNRDMHVVVLNDGSVEIRNGKRE